MKLEFKHLAPYLPYGLKVQFEGIINGKELGEYNKRYNEATKHDMFADFKEQRPIEIKGLKIGGIKIIEVCKNFTKYRIGGKGKQTHYGTERFKPILKPLQGFISDIHLADPEQIFGHTELDKIQAYLKSGDIEKVPFCIVQKFFEWHVDVFGLIDAGIAIDKTNVI